MDARKDARPGLPAIIEQLTYAGCTEMQALAEHGHDWVACTSPRGSRLTLSWDGPRGTLTLVRYITRRDGASIVGRFRNLNLAAEAAATL